MSLGFCMDIVMRGGRLLGLVAPGLDPAGLNCILYIQYQIDTVLIESKL